MSFYSLLQSTLGRWLQPAANLAASPVVAPADASVADPGTPVLPFDAPYDGIVYITDEIGDQGFQGTGVLIAPDEVLTASHVVYTTGIGVATDVEVSSGFDGQYYYPSVDGVVTHHNGIYDSGGMISLESTQSDYAIIHLGSPIEGATIFSLMSNFNSGTATTSGYPANADGQQIAYTGAVEVQSDLSVLSGASLGPGSSGGPVWVTNTDGEPTVVGLVSSYDEDDSDSTTNGNDLQISNAVLDEIEVWVTEDDGTHAPLSVTDTSTGAEDFPQPVAYTGPVAGLAHEWININSDNLNATANTPNWFIHTGSGEDAIAVTSGTNVLDGGTGSNFLVGGTGADTFFTDDRAASASIWDTLVNFHPGDAATIFGVTQAGFSFDWENNQGAAGYSGLTLHASEAGSAVIASVTLDGLTSADLTNGVLSISYGTTNGSSYMYIYDKG